MIRSLRQKHRVFWLVAALDLPVLFAAALLFRPQFPVQDFERLGDADFPEALPQVVRAFEGKGYKANLRQDRNGQHQLELYLKTPLPTPAPTLYLNITGQEQLDGNKFVGNLGGVGLYRFPIEEEPSGIKGLFFYCAIHDHTVKTTGYTEKD